MLALEKMTSFRQTSDREGLECLFLSQGKKKMLCFLTKLKTKFIIIYLSYSLDF